MLELVTSLLVGFALGYGARELIFRFRLFARAAPALGGDRTHFAPQMDYFARQGRALNAELRGHGESDKPQQEYSIEGSAEDLVWLCAQQQITKAVIVGQSMGGNIALESPPVIRTFPRA